MKDFLESLAVVVLGLFCLFVTFLFVGEPDVWDAAHAAVMTYLLSHGGVNG